MTDNNIRWVRPASYREYNILNKCEGCFINGADHIHYEDISDEESSDNELSDSEPMLDYIPMTFDEFKQINNSSAKFWTYFHFNIIFNLNGDNSEWINIKKKWYYKKNIDDDIYEYINPLRIEILKSKTFNNQKATFKELNLRSIIRHLKIINA